MKKAQFLKHWSELEPNQPLQMRPIPYKHKGSTYAQDGLRITGSKENIDSVLSCLKPLLTAENGRTRLQVSYQQTTDRDTGQKINSYNCYLQISERGKCRINGGV